MMNKVLVLVEVISRSFLKDKQIRKALNESGVYRKISDR